MSNTEISGNSGDLGRMIDANAAERTNLREGLRAMHQVRFAAYVAFALVAVATVAGHRFDDLVSG